MATMEDEHAVSTTIDGPPNCMAYDTRPLRNAFNVPWTTLDPFGQKTSNKRHTSAIVNVNVVDKIFSVVLSRRSDIAAERGALKTRRCIRNVSRALESFIGRVEKNTLLRIHASRLAGRDFEKLVIEIGKTIHEIACFDSHLGMRRLNISRGVQRKFETIVRNLNGRISILRYVSVMLT